MTFSSLTFLLLFFPIFLFGYWILPLKYSNFWILLCSLMFYYLGAHKQIIWLIIVILVSYFSASIIRMVQKNIWKKIILSTTVICLVSILLYFKCMNLVNFYFCQWFGKEFAGNNEIILPIGISFFIFQAISYIVDIYRGGADFIKNPIDMGVYIACFPQLIAGPIIRYKNIMNQINGKNRKKNWSVISEGIWKFCIGLVKKVLLANRLGSLASLIIDSSYISHYSVLYAWLGIVSYTLQIYYDFSGYTDMAIGIGKMMGFDYPENFNLPYAATSIQDFWRRWHMTLTTWFKDYVYIPLGGNRCGFLKNIRNLFIVWLLTGLWHGGSWNFILWGMGYFVLLIMEKVVKPSNYKGVLRSLYRIFSIIMVMLLWVMFRTKTLSNAFGFYQSLFGTYRNTMIDKAFLFQLKNYWLTISFGILFALPCGHMIIDKITSYKFGEGLSAFILLLLTGISFVFILMGSYDPFLYFMF